MIATILHGEGCRCGCYPYRVGYGRVMEGPRGLATPGYGDGYAPHTSIMRILSDAGEYDLHWWKYKRIRIPQICCTPRGAEENDSRQ